MSRAGHPTWDPLFIDRSPAFAPLRRSVAGLNGAGFPSVAAIQQLVDGAQPRPRTRGGHALRVVHPHAESAEPYERKVFQSGEIPVRTESWHDLFNALAWITFPLAKAALNARHVRKLEGEAPGQRGPERDALSQFDEDGMIVLSSSPELLALIRAFRWKDLFWSRRDELARHSRFLVFGHALYEKLMAPFVGMAGKAVMLEVAPPLLTSSVQDQVAAADLAMGQMIDAGLLEAPAVLQPLPVLGIPGWCPSTAEERFYSDSSYFRPGRRN